VKPFRRAEGGFSYIEVIIAVTLFVIALATILPALSQAGRNLAFAQSGYDAHLRAQSLMLIVRSALETGEALTAVTRAGEAAHAYHAAHDNFRYTVWLVGGAYGGHMYDSGNAPIATAQVNGLVSHPNRTAIVVVIWNEHDHAAARVVGFASG
jgi:type II secretory pathway pseudopilin PulG